MSQSLGRDLTAHRHILHVGLHKTGTTWLQLRLGPLFSNPQHLHTAGSHNDPLLSGVVASLFSIDRFSAAAAGQAVRGLGPSIVSVENLSGPAFRSQFDRTGWLADRSELVRRCAEVFPGALVVLGTRDAQQLQKSFYAEYVRRGGVLDVRRFEAEEILTEYFDVEAHVRRWSEQFEVLQLPLEQLRADEEAFLRLIGESLRLDVPTRLGPPVNVSLSPTRLAVLRGLNRLTSERRLSRPTSINVPGVPRLAAWVSREPRIG